MNKTNLKYVLGLSLPLIFVLYLLIINHSSWIYTVLIIITVLINAYVLNKTLFLPLKLKGYDVNKYLDLSGLNINTTGIIAFTSKSLDKVEFMKRPCDVVSNINDKTNYIIISDEFYRTNDKTIIDLLLIYEITKLRKGYHLKSLLLLVIPYILAVNIILLSIYFNYNVLTEFSYIVRVYIFPPLVVVLAYMLFKNWSNYVSSYEAKLDNYLLNFSSKEKVIEFIEKTENFITGTNEKREVFYNKIIEDRKKKL